MSETFLREVKLLALRRLRGVDTPPTQSLEEAQQELDSYVNDLEKQEQKEEEEEKTKSLQLQLPVRLLAVPVVTINQSAVLAMIPLMVGLAVTLFMVGVAMIPLILQISLVLILTR